MQVVLKMINKKDSETFWVFATILSIVLLLVVGYSRITNFRSERMDISFLIYLILAILSFYLFKYLDNLLKRDYYNQKVHSTRLIAGGYTFITLNHPKKYFKKEKLWIGYFIYLLSRIIVIGFIYLVIKLILRLI